MDIEKEREAFENHLKKMGKTDNETFSKNEDDSYQMDIIHFGWKIWQAAKAQAVPEGFVLVNKKDLVKVLNCVTDDWLIDTDSLEEFKKIESLVQDEVNAMIEAQEPTND